MDNPFRLLNLPETYDLDLASLERAYLAASSAHHPDRYIDPIEQADAADRMSAITQAYRMLKKPESRANALLQILGGPAKEDDQSLPPDLLMEVMEVREELEQAVESADQAELDRLGQWATQRREHHQARIGQLLGDDADAEALKAARLELNALRYMNRMLEQMPRQ